MKVPSFFSHAAASPTLAVLSLLLAAACHSRMTYPPGGYPYPTGLKGRDTEFYRCPIRTRETRQDSMRDAIFYEDWKATGEPNLSLRPMPTDVFRFVYGEALNPTFYIIRMTPYEMTVRIGTPTAALEQLPDTSLLAPLDLRLYRILERNYPIDDTSIHHRRRRFLDSMGHIYPQLYNPSYYLSVRNREYPHSKPWYRFTSRTIALKPGDFDKLVSTINNSHYWQLPFDIEQEAVMDGCGYSLEANTSDQYNYVGTGGACSDTGAFAKACQALVDFAGLQKKISLVWIPKKDTSKRPVVIQDVQLEDIKETPPPRKSHHPKKPHPN